MTMDEETEGGNMIRYPKPILNSCERQILDLAKQGGFYACKVIGAVAGAWLFTVICFCL